MAQIRCGILPLKIETGRYSNLPVEERLCDICNLGKVESEIHFMLECPMYSEERLTLYNAAHLDIDNRNMNDLETFTHLFKNNWRDSIRFLNVAWKKRQMFLFK